MKQQKDMPKHFVIMQQQTQIKKTKNDFDDFIKTYKILMN